MELGVAASHVVPFMLRGVTLTRLEPMLVSCGREPGVTLCGLLLPWGLWLPRGLARGLALGLKLGAAGSAAFGRPAGCGQKEKRFIIQGYS